MMTSVAPPPLALVRRARKVNRELALAYPEADCELVHRNPFELLVATTLSAQSTDQRVNLVTQVLFSRFPEPGALAGADPVEVEEIIRPTGFHHAKTRSIQGQAAMIVSDFGGEVPRTLEELVRLPGVGRKTANVVLGNAFGVPGITVDTHVLRLSQRFGWTTQSVPDRVEEDLAALFPKKEWTQMCHNVIWHGRRRCHARRPACGACPVAKWCPAYGTGPTEPEIAADLVREPRR